MVFLILTLIRIMKLNTHTDCNTFIFNVFTHFFHLFFHSLPPHLFSFLSLSSVHIYLTISQSKHLFSPVTLSLYFPTCPIFEIKVEITEYESI